MKYLLLFVFLFCSLAATAQDLIITSTGDSIKCKIIDVGANELQFRFGASGNVISIHKTEVMTYEYNFVPSRNEKAKNSKKKQKTERTLNAAEYQPFYASISAGVSNFGKASFADDIKGVAIPVNVDIAYFLHPMLGAGLKLNTSICNVASEQRFSYQDLVMFYGAALHGRFGTNKLALTVCAAGGGLTWQLLNRVFDDVSFDNESLTSFGGFVSVGVNHMVTPNIGVVVNVQSILIGSLKDKFERTPNGIGATFGVNYRF